MDFDPGYGAEPWRTLCADVPGEDVYPPADDQLYGDALTDAPERRTTRDARRSRPARRPVLDLRTEAP